MNYAKHVSVKQTPQGEPIPGTSQVENSAGGFAWAVSDWDRLDRFLVLGADSPTYYASERKLTLENAAAVERLLKVDGLRVVARVAEISDAGRAPKNDPAIFALALALKRGDEATKKAARAAVPKVCRIGTHIFQLAAAVDELGGWGRGTKGAFADWYLGQTPDALALNLVKYQNRNGWTHRDVLRKAHANPKNIASAVAPAEEWKSIDAMLRWAVGKPVDTAINGIVPGGIIYAFEAAKALAASSGVISEPGKETRVLAKSNIVAMSKLITDNALPRECVPTEFLNAPEVWDALLHAGKFGMPITALIRNLGKMSAIGLAKPLSDATKFICDRLRDKEALKAGRVHPVTLLLAHSIYKRGQGDKGKLTWPVAQEIVGALEEAFYAAFAAVEPTGKRFVLALDVSGSMGTGTVAGSGLTPREASAAMALVTARTEERVHVVGFTAGAQGLTQLAGFHGETSSLTSAIKEVSGIPFGNTDCALPIVVAEREKLEADAFMILTDNETWAGPIHAMQALRSYRQKMGIDAKLVVVAMTSAGFTIADPNDRGAIDVVGFDSAVPQVIAQFVSG